MTESDEKSKLNTAFARCFLHCIHQQAWMDCHFDAMRRCTHRTSRRFHWVRTPDMPTAEQTRAVVVDHHFPGTLRISPMSVPAKSATDVTVRVTAVSLSRGTV